MGTELQSFWSPILGLDDPAPRPPFVSHTDREYTVLVTVAQWFLLRYNERTKSIITQNIESTLNLMDIEDRGGSNGPNPNAMMSIPIRHSDKCYDESYRNP